MDSFELNKVAGAVLGTMLVVFGLGAIGDIIFAEEEPETPGYVIAVAEEPGEGEAEIAAAAEEPIAVLLANADPAAGEASARKCASCHTFEEGGANRVGPNLFDVVGRPIASVEGFAYSDALQAHAQEAGEWDFEALSAFIASPRQAVPGTTMGFAGIADPQERANLLAYLRALSADPVPLPEAPPPAAVAVGEEEVEDIPEHAEPPMPAASSAELAPVEEEIDERGGVTLDREAGIEAAGEVPPTPPQVLDQDQEAQPSGEDRDTILVLPPAGQLGAQQQLPAQTEAQAPEPAEQPGPVQQQSQALQQPDQAPAEPAGDLPPALALMSEVDVEAGQAEARKCQACHALEEGGGARVGPPLWGVVNRAIASVEGYDYSPALAEFGQGKEWDFALLDAFIQAPQTLVPGTKMIFPGIRNERDRAELLLYLSTLSDQPVPLPGAGGQAQ